MRNVLFIFTDMQRADTIGALGNPTIQTPNLDRLAREGTAFTRCYTPSPVCVPARCCMHYGLYPQRTGLYVNGRMMDDNGASLASRLSSAGYHTAAVGKCHFTPDSLARRGFDERITQEELVADYTRDDYREWLSKNGYDPVEAHGERGPMYYMPQPSRFNGEAHPTEWIAKRSMDVMDTSEQQGKPWCVMASFIHPHPPFTPPRPWTKLYPPTSVPDPHLPSGMDSLLTHINRTQNRYKWRDQGMDKNVLRMIRAYYYACISYVDHQVGRLISHLENKGRLDDTLILFSSDHGEYLGDYGCFGKRSMHDASARVPLIARLPARFDAGAICSAPTSLVDIHPTLMGVAGLDPEDTDGLDLADVAAGKAQREHVFSQWGKGANAIYLIASKDWKYIYSAGEEKEILFDRVRDPLESRNAAEDPEAAGAKAGLKQALLDYLNERHDKEAVAVECGQLDWKRHPRLTQDYLGKDPDAGLLYQDEPEGLPEKAGECPIPRKALSPAEEKNFFNRMYYGDSHAGTKNG
jgi:choline-sulfatase